MRIDIISLFPETFIPLQTSIPGRAQKKGALELHLHQLRDYGLGKHRQVDDTPCGGGPGMILRPEPIFECLEALPQSENTIVVYPTPQGTPFRQKHAMELSSKEHLIFLCGHYEGVDQRVRDHLIDREYSLGDYVISNGELSAMVIADAVIRLLPGVIKKESYVQDSFYQPILDHPHYTKPAVFRDLAVPEILLGGHHKLINEWRHEKALEKTQRVRPDLLKDLDNSD